MTIEVGKWISQIDDGTLEYMSRVRPVVEVVGQGLFFIEAPEDLRSTCFTWDPNPKEKAEGLSKVVDIITYHPVGPGGNFMPTIAEVLAQIPLHLPDASGVMAFQIIEGPEDREEKHREGRTPNDYFVATVRLYRQKQDA